MVRMNVMIRGFATESVMSCKEKKVGETFGLLRMEPYLVSFKGVIKELCEKERMEEAKEVVREMNRKGLAPDCETYNALICGMCKVRNMLCAVELYDQMRVRGLSPNERTYMSLIDLLCTWWLDKAYKVFNEMIASGFLPSVATYNKFITAYLSSERVEQALGIFSAMAERGLSPDLVSYNAVISKFCQDGELEKALEIKAETVEKGILPDDVTYSALIQALCLQGSLPEAFDLFLEMLRGDVSPSNSTYTRLMYAYCLVGEFSMAFHLHDEMRHRGFLPDFVIQFSPSLVTFNALIHGLCSLERVDEALGILRGMPEMGLSPDAVSYNTVLFGFCQIRELKKAYELKVEMDEKIIWLDEYTYESLMEGLSDEVTYSSLLNDYFAQGNMQKVFKLEREMTRNGYLPDSVTLGVFINGLNKKATTSIAKGILLRMISSQCLTMPSYIIYDTLIENCSYVEFKSAVGLVKDFSTRGLVNEAAIAHERMHNMSVKPDGAVYNLLIFDHCRRGNVNKAYEMYKEMVHYGFFPHMFSVLSLIHALYYDRKNSEMGWVIRNTLRSCNLNDSELHQVLNEIEVKKCKIDALLNALAKIAVDGMLLDRGKCSYASDRFTPATIIVFSIFILKGLQDVFSFF
ncbi:pentatricopeptide repeat-containing protein At5g39710-like [Lotus japonicus]|uniref:pentatricopeptide repeat-containing protein At5g39710-like n=1 Tax=Lotus japonicus TaxID=34305 RepID=UPI00258411C4|nr:pentatricopeptide repeat-containing protein At5g39710-like [Lotus japonicus]